MAGMTRARIGVFGAAFQALADHDVAVIVRGVDIRRLNDRYAGQRAPMRSGCNISTEQISGSISSSGLPATVGDDLTALLTLSTSPRHATADYFKPLTSSRSSTGGAPRMSNPMRGRCGPMTNSGR